MNAGVQKRSPNKGFRMLRRTQLARFCLKLALSGAVASPAGAYRWPGEEAGPGAAIAARVIGQHCVGLLSASEIGELDAYIAKATSEWKRKAEAQKNNSYRSPSPEAIMRQLTETYTKKYRDPLACDADAGEEARDMLMRVRKAMASGKPIYPDENDPNRKPEIGEALIAKVTDEKCRGALTALELAQVELFIAKYWVWLANNAVESDARSTMERLKSAASDVGIGFRSAKDCTADAVAKAREVAARVRKAEAADAR
jgi:hypothetical protein